MLVQVAWAASRTGGTYLGAKYRKLAFRIGRKKALIALARIILVSIYQMIRKKEPYNDLGPDYLDSLNRERTVKNLKRRIESLGYNVVLLPGSCPASGDGASRTLPALETPLGSIPNLTGLEVGVGRTAVLSAPEGL